MVILVPVFIFEAVSAAQEKLTLLSQGALQLQASSLETIMGFTFSVAASLNFPEMYEGTGGGSGAEFHKPISVSGKLSGPGGGAAKFPDLYLIAFTLNYLYQE